MNEKFPINIKPISTDTHTHTKKKINKEICLNWLTIG